MSGTIPKLALVAQNAIFSTSPSGINRAWAVRQDAGDGMTLYGWDQAVGDPLFSVRGSQAVVTDVNQADQELAETGGWYNNPITPGQPSMSQLYADGNLTWTNPVTGIATPGFEGAAAAVQYLLSTLTDLQAESALGQYMTWMQAQVNTGLANIFANPPPPYVVPQPVAEDQEFPPAAKDITNMIGASIAVSMQMQGGLSPANAEIPICTGFAPPPTS